MTGVRTATLPMKIRLILFFVWFALAGLPARAVEREPAPVPDAALAATEKTEDLWGRVRGGFRLPQGRADQVLVMEQQFMAYRGSFQQAVNRSRLYLYHIVEEVDKRGMPMELALLPIIESGFNATARSSQKASGIWQFMPATGKVYGLHQNNWYDGRLDVVQATEAALDHLQALYRKFGDWELTLAAYNCGEGCLARALTRSGSNNLADLRLPPTTVQYVPKLLAVRNIIQNPERFGVQLPPMSNTPYFLPVNLSKPIEARIAARLAEMDMADFIALNPGFHRRVIHTETSRRVLLPAEKMETFQFNLYREGLDKGSLASYSGKRGESLANIASKFDVTVQWLKEHNPLNPSRGKLSKSQELMVPRVVAAPSAAATTAVAVAAVVVAPVPAPEKKAVVPSRMASLEPTHKAKSGKSGKAHARVRKHTVRKGDTLFTLARHYKVKVSDIERLNDMPRILRPGMKLEIPAAPAG